MAIPDQSLLIFGLSSFSPGCSIMKTSIMIFKFGSVSESLGHFECPQQGTLAVPDSDMKRDVLASYRNADLNGVQIDR